MILYCCNEKPHNITFALEKFMQSLLMLPEYSDWPYLVESWLVDWSSCESILNCDRPLYPSSAESKLCFINFENIICVVPVFTLALNQIIHMGNLCHICHIKSLNGDTSLVHTTHFMCLKIMLNGCDVPRKLD